MEAISEAKPSAALLTPANHTLVFIDMEGQMAFATKNIDISELRNNVAIVAGGSKMFDVPTIVTVIDELSFSGPVFPELSDFYPKETFGYFERTTMNAWEDGMVHKAITGKGNKKIVFAGLWTSVCIATAALSAVSEGYEVYFIADACGDVSTEAHNMSILRMSAAGVSPLTSLQYLLELQRDWAKKETAKGVVDLAKKYGGAYGIGIQYGQAMVPRTV